MVSVERMFEIVRRWNENQISRLRQPARQERQPLQRRPRRDRDVQHEPVSGMDRMVRLDNLFKILRRRVSEKGSRVSAAEKVRQPDRLSRRFGIGRNLRRRGLSDADSLVRVDELFKVLRRRNSATDS